MEQQSNDCNSSARDKASHLGLYIGLSKSLSIRPFVKPIALDFQAGNNSVSEGGGEGVEGPLTLKFERATRRFLKFDRRY